MDLADILSFSQSNELGLLTESKAAWSSQKAVISGVFFDHRRIVPDSIFVAIRGSKSDGHEFLAEAVEKGARVLIVEAENEIAARKVLEGKLGDPKMPDSLIGAYAPSTRKILAHLAARFYANPSRHLFVAAVTGTNGKTTATHMIEHVLKTLGSPTGVIGTIDHHLGERIWPTMMTTPDPVELHLRLKEFIECGARAVALEASSHALDQYRLDAVDFDFAAFTNLTRDHLDYHKDMDDYFGAKLRLFDVLLTESAKAKRVALFNLNDPWCSKAYEILKSKNNLDRNFQILGFGSSSSCSIRFDVIEQGFDGVRFRLSHDQGVHEVRIQMPGRHNVENAVIAFSAGMAAGFEAKDVVHVLSQLAGVPGRLERVPNSRGLHVFVDYAHTDDALNSILALLNGIRNSSDQNPNGKARIITVFGCGGDRDPGKRPLMMRAAIAGSDEVILTSDNPRFEDPEKILDDAMSAVSAAEKAKVHRFVERRVAIGKAIQIARPGDVIVIAGKGHEQTQQLGSMKIPFADATVAKEIMEGKH